MFYETSITETFFVETGLLLDTRGFKWVINDIDTGEVNVDFYTLSVPIVVKGKFEVASRVKIFAQAGLFADVFLSGREITEDKNSRGEIEIKKTTIKFDENSIFPDRFNFGLNFGGGVEYQKFVFSLEYNLGLRDMNKVEDESFKFNAFKIGVGYKF